MNRALVLAALRQRLTSPVRLLLLAFSFGPTALMSCLSGTLAFVHGDAVKFAMILAAGSIGQDVSSGVLQLTFARPVSRPSYVLSRWFAAGAGGALLAFAQLLAVAAVLASRGVAAPVPDVLVALLEAALLSFAAAAVLIMFSSFVNGLGDVAVFFVLVLFAQAAGQVATFKHWAIVERACAEINRTLWPDVHVAWLAGHGTPAWTDLVTLLSTVAIALSVAIVVVNRKELSYAAD